MKRGLLPVMVMMLLLAAGLAGAEGEKPWKGSGEIGFLQTTGNSETESLKVKSGFSYEQGHVLGELKLGAIYSSEETEVDGVKEDKTSAEKYSAAAKGGYKFTDVDYVFAIADYVDDRFSGYDYRTNYGVGYGRKIINTETVKLVAEIGPGYRYDKQDDGSLENEAVARGYLMCSYNFSETAALQQELTILAGSDNTNTKSVTALKAQIVGALSMKASYTLDHNSQVPEDKNKTDRETALTLVYDF